MIILKISDYEVEEGVEHLATTWQISRNEDFTDILITVQEDEENLTSIFINEEVTEGTRYWARAMFVYDIGLSRWSNVSTGIASDTDETELYFRIPVNLPPPSLSTFFEQDSSPHTFLKIDASLQTNPDNNNHEYTSWLIEDTDGNIILYIKESKENLTSLIITTILERNQVYVIKAKFHFSSGDVTDYGSVVIYTSHDYNLNLLDYNGVIEIYSDNYVLDIGEPPNFIEAEIEVYDNFNLIYSEVRTTLNIPAKDLLSTLSEEEYNKVYVIRLRGKYTGDIYGEWTYHILMDIKLADALPHWFPYNLYGDSSDINYELSAVLPYVLPEE